MTVANDLLALLERFSGRTHLPRVRALHLPPLATAGGKNGEFCGLELEDGSIGLSYVLLDDTLPRLAAENGTASLAGADPLALARRYASGQGVERTLGFAAVNALTRCLFDRAGFAPPSSKDSIGGLDPVAGDHVGMIGLFSPLLRPCVEAGARLTVLELKAELAGERDGYVVTLDAARLAECNKILSTSTVVLNDTLEKVLSACRSAERFAMIGPGAGCLPDPLFARGITTIGGSWIMDRAGFADALAAGTSWSAYARKFAIDVQCYPGAEALLTRLK